MSNRLSAILLVLMFADAASAQLPNLINPDFEAGSPGLRPLGWRFGFGPKLGYSAVTTTDDCYSGKQCGALRSNNPLESDGHSFLFQYVDAKPYRGMKFRFRAAIRTRVPGLPNGGGLLVRIHRSGGGSCFFDNMSERRITSGEWKFYEISGNVCADATDLETGVQLWGSGLVRVDDTSLVFGVADSPLLPNIVKTSAQTSN